MTSRPKVLFAARVDSHIRHFHLPYMRWFQEQGYEVHAASQGTEQFPWCDKKFDIAMDRFPLTPRNLQALRQLKRIIEREQYRLIHCHTPAAGVLTRLAARKSRNSGTKVLYTAHGFHFFKGAPLKNWLFYYPPEKILARVTDGLILINREDCELATRKNFPAGAIHFTHGIGIDLSRFPIPTEEARAAQRKQLAIAPETFVMIYTAELSARKNQIRLIHALANLKDQLAPFVLLLAGDGDKGPELEQAIAEKKLENNVRLLGYRQDIPSLLAAADLAISTSTQEGLPVNILESLASGLPVLASGIRGHRDIITAPEQGSLFRLNSLRDLEEKLLALYAQRDTLADPKMKQLRRQSITPWSLEKVLPEYEEIYRHYLELPS